MKRASVQNWLVRALLFVSHANSESCWCTPCYWCTSDKASFQPLQQGIPIVSLQQEHGLCTDTAVGGNVDLFHCGAELAQIRSSFSHVQYKFSVSAKCQAVITNTKRNCAFQALFNQPRCHAITKLLAMLDAYSIRSDAREFGIKNKSDGLIQCAREIHQVQRERFIRPQCSTACVVALQRFRVDCTNARPENHRAYLASQSALLSLCDPTTPGPPGLPGPPGPPGPPGTDPTPSLSPAPILAPDLTPSLSSVPAPSPLLAPSSPSTGVPTLPASWTWTPGNSTAMNLTNVKKHVEMMGKPVYKKLVSEATEPTPVPRGNIARRRMRLPFAHVQDPCTTVLLREAVYGHSKSWRPADRNFWLQTCSKATHISPDDIDISIEEMDMDTCSKTPHGRERGCLWLTTAADHATAQKLAAGLAGLKTRKENSAENSRFSPIDSVDGGLVVAYCVAGSVSDFDGARVAAIKSEMEARTGISGLRITVTQREISNVSSPSSNVSSVEFVQAPTHSGQVIISMTFPISAASAANLLPSANSSTVQQLVSSTTFVPTGAPTLQPTPTEVPAPTPTHPDRKSVV